MLDAYEAHDRMIPGTFDDHLSAIAETWIKRRQRGDTLAVVASTNATSTRSTKRYSAFASSLDTSTRSTSPGSPVTNMPTSATWWSPAETTGPCSQPQESRYATARPGPWWQSALTAR